MKRRNWGTIKTRTGGIRDGETSAAEFEKSDAGTDPQLSDFIHHLLPSGKFLRLPAPAVPLLN